MRLNGVKCLVLGHTAQPRNLSFLPLTAPMVPSQHCKGNWCHWHASELSSASTLPASGPSQPPSPVYVQSTWHFPGWALVVFLHVKSPPTNQEPPAFRNHIFFIFPTQDLKQCPHTASS